jgi:hypothetical protein
MNKVYILIAVDDDSSANFHHNIEGVYTDRSLITRPLNTWEDFWETDDDGKKHWMLTRKYIVEEHNIITQ